MGAPSPLVDVQAEVRGALRKKLVMGEIWKKLNLGLPNILFDN